MFEVSENLNQLFIEDTEPSVTGLILAGPADFKNQLALSEIVDTRLRPIIMAIYDICYGGEEGFNQAIHLSANLLKDVRLVREQELLQKLFQTISTNGACSFGIRETMMAFAAGAVETMIMYEELDVYRCVMRNVDEGETIEYFTTAQLEKNEHMKSGRYDALLEKTVLADWMAENHHLSGIKLEYVSGKSSEGAQFIRGLGGIGALLRFILDFNDYKETEFDNVGFDEDFDSDDLL